MTIGLWVMLALAVASVIGAVWFLKDLLMDMGASKEREERTYRTLKGVKDGNKAKNSVDAMSDSAVDDELQKWTRS